VEGKVILYKGEGLDNLVYHYEKIRIYRNRKGKLWGGCNC
jgi:hypothetical protein